jgi:hypothetical protein
MKLRQSKSIARRRVIDRPRLQWPLDVLIKPEEFKSIQPFL